MRISGRLAAVVAAVVAADVSRPTRTGWLVTAAAYLTIAALAAVGLHVAIATGMARRPLGRRLAVLCRYAPLAAVAVSAAVIVLALSAPPSPPVPFAPGLRPALVHAPAAGPGSAPIPAPPTAVEFTVSSGGETATGSERAGLEALAGCPVTHMRPGHALAEGLVRMFDIFGVLCDRRPRTAEDDMARAWAEVLAVLQPPSAALLGHQGCPAPASAATQRRGTPGQIPAGS